jgi:hypothetical protein
MSMLFKSLLHCTGRVTIGRVPAQVAGRARTPDEPPAEARIRFGRKRWREWCGRVPA